MCVEAYVGCPQCYRAADSGEVYEIRYQTETIHYYLDADGDTDYNQEPGYQEDLNAEDDGYGCECGWRGHQLDPECIREDCECSECVEPDYNEVEVEVADEDAYVTLCRPPSNLDELPLELRVLAEDRCVWVAVMPRWRSAELFADWSHLINVEYEPSYSVPETLARELMPTYPAYDDREVCTA
jgi:hypothetical protein